MWFYAFPIFLSALLLFQVQPIIAKHILPWFGGTPAVWTTCMVFFQVALLAGYAYAHASIRLLSPRRQAILHGLLLVACLALLPAIPAEAWKPIAGRSEVWRILALLAATIGGPYLVLAANGPLLQAWFSREFPKSSPYRLFALSNAGSLLALLSYPFLLEPGLSLRWQEYSWSALFVLFAASCGFCAWRSYRTGKAAADVPQVEPPAPVAAEAIQAPLPPAQPARLLPPYLAARVEPGPPIRSGLVRAALTLLLPACACMILLATTNQMTQDLPVVPFLWILPLALYLLTFILCFDREWWYFRPLWIPLMAAGLVGIYLAVAEGVEMSTLRQLLLYSAGLLACCMVCHGELARLKPAPEHLTGYYLLISAGGAMGGLFVTLVAPALLLGFWEYQGSLIACGALLLAVIVLDRRFFRFLRWVGPTWLRAGAASTVLSLLTVLAVHFVIQARDDLDEAVDIRRNFYGVLSVDVRPDFEADGEVVNLMHGRIMHGSQYTNDDYRMVPVSYYGPSSGIGIAVRALRRRGLPAATEPALLVHEIDSEFFDDEEDSDAPPSRESWLAGNNLRIGAVGLGAGVVAAYGKGGDYIRFYEINPDIIRLSDAHFTYRKDTLAETEVVLGDARLSMERAKDRGEAGRFDVIVLDAFSGDSIPLHLLTSQAMKAYFYHLKADGVLAFHISNRYVKLEGLVRGLAAEAGKLSMLVDSDGGEYGRCDTSSWVLVTASKDLLDAMMDQPGAIEWPEDDYKPIVFTDDYSNLFQLLRFGDD